MPQIIPYYIINQYSFIIITISIIIYLTTQIFLPYIVSIYISRGYIKSILFIMFIFIFILLVKYFLNIYIIIYYFSF